MGAVAFVGALYVFCLYEMAQAITTGQVYARHLGWVTFAEHPAAFVFNAAIAALVLVALPVLGLYLWSVKRRERRTTLRKDI